MKKSTSHWLFALTIAWHVPGAGSALAQPVVTLTGGNGNCVHSVIPLGGNRYDIEITGEGGIGAVSSCRITPGPGTVVLEDVRVTVESDQVSISIVDNLPGDGTFAAVESVVKAGGSGSGAQDFVISQINIDGTLGVVGVPHGSLVAAGALPVIIVEGDVMADIEVGPLSSGADAILDNLTITGDLQGDVLVNDGSITLINVGGDIGSATNTVAVESSSTLVNCEADSIWADVKTVRNGGFGVLFRIQARTGDFVGTIETTRVLDGINRGIFVAGDLDADIEVRRFVDAPIQIGGVLAPERTIEIGEDLNGDIDFTDANGLEGQIIINRRHDSTLWTGDITVGSTTLSPTPFYTQSKDDLGGGSVGLVPFNFHGVDCSPADGGTICGWDGTIVMEYYGPVTVESTNYANDGLPVYVERTRTDLQVGCIPELGQICDPCDPNSVFGPTVWTDVTDQFTFELHPNGNLRQIRLTNPLIATGSCTSTRYAQFLYRVRPRDSMANPSETNWLRSDVVASGAINTNPLVHIPFWDPTMNWRCASSDENYGFFVDFKTATLDLSQNGVVDGQDISQWVTDQPDLDASGTADTADAQYIIDHQGEPGSD